MVQIEQTPKEQPAKRRYSREIGSHPYKQDLFMQQAREKIEAISIRKKPIYYEPIAYAIENEEVRPYWDSIRCNAACAKDVKAAIADHYDGYRLEKGAADAIIQKYGQERTFFVLANTIQLMRDDGRVDYYLESCHIGCDSTKDCHVHDVYSVHGCRLLSSCPV